MSQQMASMVGSTGTVPSTQAADAAAGTAGPVMPGGAKRTGQSGMMGMLAGLKDMSSFAIKLGDTPEEREKNAKAFAAAVKDIGSLTANLSESTLMQSMMKNMGGPAYLDTGASPSGGVAAIPKTFDPSLASHIVNQMGYK